MCDENVNDNWDEISDIEVIKVQKKGIGEKNPIRKISKLKTKNFLKSSSKLIDCINSLVVVIIKHHVFVAKD